MHDRVAGKDDPKWSYYHFSGRSPCPFSCVMPRNGFAAIPLAAVVVVTAVSETAASCAEADAMNLQARIVITPAVMGDDGFLMSPDRFLISIVV